MKKIELKTLGILPGKDITIRLFEIFSENQENTEFVFEKGDYYFSPQLEYDYRLSNTERLPVRKLGIWLKNMKNIIVDGNGSRFLYSGQMQAVTIDRSENIVFRNCTIDWEKPLVAEGTVMAFTDKTIDLHIDGKAFPHRFVDGTLEFDVGNGEWYPLRPWGMIQFDRETGNVRRNTGDMFSPKKVEALSDDDFRMYLDRTDTSVGNVFVLRHNSRFHAGIFTEKSRNVTVENVTVHSCAGLGCLAQFSEDLTYRRVHFIPNRKVGRFISNGRDDGMHITCCKGTVTITESTFVGLMDDPVNVHSCSVIAEKLIDGKTVLCRYGHSEACGFLSWAGEGDVISFINRHNMSSEGTAKALSYELTDTRHFILRFENELDDRIKELIRTENTIALDNLENTASFVCTKNRFGSCRARGVLISTSKPIKISQNVFSSSGSAILVAGDANGWFESGECHDVEISDNVFTDTCLSSDYQFCEGIISVCPVVPEPDVDKPFHKNIRITGNSFDTPDVPVLYAFSAGDLVFENNRIFRSPAAEKWHRGNSMIKLSYCRNVSLENNSFVGNFPLEMIEKDNCR